MGLTYQSSGKGALRETYFNRGGISDYTIALAGNPNTGKSTIFNALTGLKQHTGNWPGKTVVQAVGTYRHAGRKFTLVDLPGTYSLLANSPEEEIARDFICFADLDATVVVVDAVCLERNLNLVLQVLEITPKAVVCLNLIDEAKRKKIVINHELLSRNLGVPVVPTVARSREGMTLLMETVTKVASGEITSKPRQLCYGDVLEPAVSELTDGLQPLLPTRFNRRWVALRLIDGDYTFFAGIKRYINAQGDREEMT